MQAGVHAERALREAGAQVMVLTGSTAEQTRSLAKQAVHQHPDGVVVVGGDGTMMGIVDVLANAEVPVTLVPAGTGDDLARALGIPTDDALAAATVAVRGHPRRIDVASVESQGRRRFFLTIAALGFDAKVSERTNTLRYPRGRARYYLALLIEVMRLSSTDFLVRFDGGAAESLPGILLAVGNTASYGGGMPICRGAVPDDGLLEIVHVAPVGRLRLLRLFPLLLRGEHLARREVHRLSASEVHVSSPGLLVYADGERVGADECVISISPMSLNMMMPEV